MISVSLTLNIASWHLSPRAVRLKVIMLEYDKTCSRLFFQLLGTDNIVQCAVARDLSIAVGATARHEGTAIRWHCEGSGSITRRTSRD